ncbi:tRNA splicing endonuclease subunit sen2 [Conoideocrella luteorostrata]|uniref:tRNA-intron lyase n=1 Tax=Conoideocrella luteorostrata TaxID=1105319 RepID=A0AAJ0CL51_9HYPO|nr:tRNA splicing endonuclease subunit sen2 [Conoideocrella luteorostrata]
MAEIQTQRKENGHITAAPAQQGAKTPSQGWKPSIHQIYALPAPIRTFPLPVFYPNNPISLFTIAYAWLRQTLSPPPSEPSVIHQGVWSEATNSIHVTDGAAMRALWEQGFYGKGSLSRSEPNWLKRELVRKGQQEMHVSEILTAQRREERAQVKWERARLEQEAIRQTRLEEAERAAAVTQSKLATLLPPLSPPIYIAPVGPLELLSLPNSEAEVVSRCGAASVNETLVAVRAATQAVTVPLPNDILPSSIIEANGRVSNSTATSVVVEDSVAKPQAPCDNAIGRPQLSASETSSSSDVTEGQSLKRQKSVRFSPKVESTTFNLADPPSPHFTVSDKSKDLLMNGDDNASSAHDVSTKSSLTQNGQDTSSLEIVNKEHLQLTPEEAFFLTFAFGALCVSDPKSGNNLTTKELLTIFRQHSYFPPRKGPDEPDLQPDDSFLIHYAVYHHFRSLGWVPRAGIKFGVDWLLYRRGPVFDHAQFGLIVIPSYSDPWWKARGIKGPKKTWPWLHSVVRVLSHVLKSLVLVYVDVPPPPKFDAALESGYAEALRLYKVREITVKRWSANRNR